MMGSITDAPDGKAVAGSVFAAVGVYGVSISPPPSFRHELKGVGEQDADIRGNGQVFLIFCGLQAFLHVRESRKGQISLN